MKVKCKSFAVGNIYQSQRFVGSLPSNIDMPIGQSYYGKRYWCFLDAHQRASRADRGVMTNGRKSMRVSRVEREKRETTGSPCPYMPTCWLFYVVGGQTENIARSFLIFPKNKQKKRRIFLLIHFFQFPSPPSASSSSIYACMRYEWRYTEDGKGFQQH